VVVVFGFWVLGSPPTPQTPNPQSPIPNPQKKKKIKYYISIIKKFNVLNIFNLNFF